MWSLTKEASCWTKCSRISPTRTSFYNCIINLVDACRVRVRVRVFGRQLDETSGRRCWWSTKRTRCWTRGSRSRSTTSTATCPPPRRWSWSAPPCRKRCWIWRRSSWTCRWRFLWSVTSWPSRGSSRYGTALHGTAHGTANCTVAPYCSTILKVGFNTAGGCYVKAYIRYGTPFLVLHSYY